MIGKRLAAAAALAGAAIASALAGPPARAQAPRAPNEMGRIPVLEYHIVGDHEARFTIERGHFRRQLEFLYAHGFRPVSVADLLAREIDLPAGLSPIVFTFDDSSPSQFSYIERDGALVIDPESAVGIWIDFQKRHPDWGNKATFCLLSGGAAGHSFFGNENIAGQKTAWRFPKVRWLAAQGFELCSHTLWHATLSKYPDAVVQEQIARGQLAIDSAAPDAHVVTFSLPRGAWPTNRPLAWEGEWTDPRTGRVLRYNYAAVLLVGGGPARSPFDPLFDPHSIPRVQVWADELEKLIARMDSTGERYVSAGLAPR